jgi:hypothetical protein
MTTARDLVGPASQRVTRSQVAFVRQHAFAWTWMPRQYLGARGAPLVLTAGPTTRSAVS